VHLAVVAPAFTLSQRDSEYSRKPPNALSLSRYQTCKKKKKKRPTWTQVRKTENYFVREQQ